MRDETAYMKSKLYKFKVFVLNELPFLVYILYLRKNRKSNSKRKRVLIFAQGRTGSTLLDTLICSTSYFKQRGELLSGKKRNKIKFPYLFITGLTNVKPKNNFVFHLKIYNLTKDREINGERKIDPAVFLNKLQKDGWKFIYLHRKNKLNHVLSNKIATKRKVFHQYDDQEEKFKLHLNPIEVKEAIEERKCFDSAELKALANIDFIQINYEDDLENSDNHQKTINYILDFIGLKNRKCHTLLKKINKSSQKDVIENYEEVISFLKEEGMSEYIQ